MTKPFRLSKKFKPKTLEEFARWSHRKHLPTEKEKLGYHKAVLTRAARIAKECTIAHHTELSKTKAYCPLCRHSIKARPSK